MMMLMSSVVDQDTRYKTETQTHTKGDNSDGQIDIDICIKKIQCSMNVQCFRWLNTMKNKKIGLMDIGK